MSESIFSVGYQIRNEFFDRETIISRVDEGVRKPLSMAGAFIRTSARSSIRKPRRTRLTELPPDRRISFERLKRLHAAHGEPPPKLPYAPSAPGEPPRTPTGKLRETIFFAFDRMDGANSVVVGAIKLSGSKGQDVPSVLEHGSKESIFGHDVTIEGRPYMRPALERNLDNIPAMFEGIF